MQFRALNALNQHSPLRVISYDLNNLLNFTRQNLPSVAHFLSPSGEHLENQTFLSAAAIAGASVSPVVAMAIVDAADMDAAKATIRDVHRRLFSSAHLFEVDSIFGRRTQNIYIFMLIYL